MSDPTPERVRALSRLVRAAALLAADLTPPARALAEHALLRATADLMAQDETRQDAAQEDDSTPAGAVE